MSDSAEKIEKTNKKIKVENPKGTITLNKALEMLKDKSDIEKMGLRIAANRDGFKSEHVGNGKERYLLDLAKFKKWIKNTIDAIPEGFILIGKAARDLSITTQYAYMLIKKNKIKTKKVGAGRGKIYVDFATLQNTFKSKKKIKEN